ncbi:hypothetical protein F5Y15DRAFT_54473 [Xylariaceae sp. FL0016]|nr:hypothetical protein F5Y15DRAFT_54473 [Xylariaceae sp. FL0016]
MPLSKLTEFGDSGASSSQQPAPGGLFGSSAANSSTPKTGGLFGNAPTTGASQTQQPSSLFGASTAAATSQPQQSGGGLFGASTTAAASQPQQSGGLFGSSTQAQPQTTQAGGGLFGSTTQNQPQTQSTGGLFGNAPNTTQAPGLFGSQPANNATGGGFLGQSTQQKPGLFGSLNTQPQQSQPNAFAQSQQQQQQQQQPAVGLGGTLGFGLTMGQSATQQTVPGVRIDVSNLKGTTRFNDLQEDLQKQIESVDKFILEQQARKGEVDSFMPNHGEMLESLPADVKFVTRKYDGARNALQSAAQAIESARVLVNQDADAARLSFRAIDNLKLPSQYHTSNFWSPRQHTPGTANAESDGQDLVGFFSKAANEMEDQMNKYGKNLTEIETHMHGVSDGLVDQLQRMMATKNGASSGSDEKIQELASVLRDFEQGIMKVAGDVASAREGMTRLQVGDFMANEGNHNGVY